ncbi:MAG: hypothetical protein U1A78_02125 [Polyangia bacterium]
MTASGMLLALLSVLPAAGAQSPSPGPQPGVQGGGQPGAAALRPAEPSKPPAAPAVAAPAVAPAAAGAAPAAKPPAAPTAPATTAAAKPAAASGGAVPFVVTAPWAAPSQAPGARQPELSAAQRWEPPPLNLKAPPPLTPQQRAIVQATKSEKLPEPTWLRYVLSNEWRHDVTFPKLAGLGGVYIGVATDQNYTMAAAMSAELLVTMDYDAEVVAMHRIYHAFINASPTAQEMRAWFKAENAYKAGEFLVNTAPNKEDGARLAKIYARYRDRVAVYLWHVANTRVGSRHPTWLGDPEAYGYIRALVQGGRVLAVQGDLNGTTTLRSIGDTARALGLNVHVLYTSNAEGFFKYTQNFRDNIESLPRDDKSVMLRTFKHGMVSPPGDMWHYNLHQMNDFIERLKLPGYVNIYRVMQDLQRTPEGKKATEAIGVSYYDATVPRG